MSDKKLTNQEMADFVVNQMPEGYQSNLKGKSGIDLYNIMADYPDIKNSFITTLTNKVGKSLIYSKLFENPLAMMKKGKLEYGETIEQMFVHMAESKNFDEHYTGSSSVEGDLIRAVKPQVDVLYISKNFDKKAKSSISDKDLRKAFTSSNGMNNLVVQIINSVISALNNDEFLRIKNTLIKAIETGEMYNYNASSGTETTTGMAIGTVLKQTPYVVTTTDVKSLSKEIREAVGYMKFPSDKFNLAKVYNWCNPEDLVLITTPTQTADLDVNVLASAFHVSMADFSKTRVIEVDQLPSGIFQKTGTALVDKIPTALTTSDTITKDATKTPKAILCDKDFLQFWEEDLGSGSFYNPDKKVTNNFMNREAIVALCLFSNLAIFY